VITEVERQQEPKYEHHLKSEASQDQRRERL
jgi:hypothetical protein